MHSAGLKLTQLTYTRLEDNLIRHRGDRLHYITKIKIHSSCEIDYICARVDTQVYINS